MKLVRILTISLVSAILSSCQNGGNSPSQSSNNNAKDFYAIALAIAPSVNYTIPTDLNGDCSFNSQIVSNTTTVTAYLNSSVAFGQSCTSEVRTCSDGLLSGSFSFATCAVSAPASCLFNGQTLASGQSTTAYTNSTVPSGDACTSEIRTCTNGVLSGANQYSTCTIDAPASCLFDGQSIVSGQSVPAFLNSAEAYGSTCQLEYRTCDNGVLSGSNQFSSCQVDLPASCLFNGQTVANGATISAFLNSSVAFGETCSSEIRTCLYGVLSGGNQFASCNVGSPAACLFNGQTLAHGQSVNAYATSGVDYAQMCAAETRVCDNGHLSGSFQFASCDAGQGASCLFDGNTIPNGASVTAFSVSTASTSSGCKNEQRYCNNGTLSGSYSFGSCKVNQNAACLFNGKTIASGQAVIAYKNAKSKYEISAESYSKPKCESEIRLCTNGFLAGNYTQTSCTNQDYDDENGDDEDMIKICKHVVEIKHKENYTENHSNGLHLGWYKHKERFNCGKHLGWYKHKNRDTHPTCHNSSEWYHDKENNGHH